MLTTRELSYVLPMKLDVQRRLGRRVSDLRRRCGYTQERLAEECGFTVKFISSIERGKVNVPLRTMAAIAEALNASISELALGVDVAVPREVRTLEQLLAGRPRVEQAKISRMLAAMGELLPVMRDPGK
ncbi:MAG TPA: helix-turn-helix transcriptional regulator [Kofleriaceae bacterium]|nr:helix-turn-helix transcriptional regulator [Kofleriaceae bacterium]